MTRASWMDAHCHLADPRLAGRLSHVLERSRRAGVCGWVQGGVSPADWDAQLELEKRTDGGFVPAFGLHPWWVASLHDSGPLLPALEKLEARLTEVRLLGETGLDRLPRHAEPPAWKRQQEAFTAQLELARRFAKPLVLHVVRAHDEALMHLKTAGLGAGGIVHSFSGSRDIARKYLDLGFHLSVSGFATHPRARSLAEALPYVPPDRLLLETDSPDQLYGLAPTTSEAPPLNEPANLPAVAEAVLRLRGGTSERLSRDALLTRCTQNLRELLGL